MGWFHVSWHQYCQILYSREKHLHVQWQEIGCHVNLSSYSQKKHKRLQRYVYYWNEWKSFLPALPERKLFVPNPLEVWVELAKGFSCAKPLFDGADGLRKNRSTRLQNRMEIMETGFQDINKYSTWIYHRSVNIKSETYLGPNPVLRDVPNWVKLESDGAALLLAACKNAFWLAEGKGFWPEWLGFSRAPWGLPSLSNSINLVLSKFLSLSICIELYLISSS